jgi:hypothetical protein
VTFSDTRIEKLVKESFIPVWESAAEVTTAVYDLGEGKEVKATVGGEIAIYFCRPDGKVFDILPALQSPKVTYKAMKRALAFYEKTGASDNALAEYHQQALVELVGEKVAKERLEQAGKLSVAPTADGKLGVFGEKDMMRTIAAKAVVSPSAGPAPILIIEPRGLEGFSAQIHAALAASPPKPPSEWKQYVFVDLLGQDLKGGGELRFDIEKDSGSLAITGN